MFCSGCGQALAQGQGFCSHCGRAAVAQAIPVAGLQLESHSYAGKVSTLSILWFIYACFSLLMGIVGMVIANAFLSGHFGAWMNGPWMHGPCMHAPGMNGPGTCGSMPMWIFPAIMHFAWIFLTIRFLLALAAGWGLRKRTASGRILAIIAAVLSLVRFPIGTALGVWTLVVLLGAHNAALYEEI